jgi:hypothetical protein
MKLERVSDSKGTETALEHDSEKACPGLDPGWQPGFGKDHAETKGLSLNRFG